MHVALCTHHCSLRVTAQQAPLSELTPGTQFVVVHSSLSLFQGAAVDPLPTLPNLRLEPSANGRLFIHFPYHPDTVQRIKTVAGRRWHGEEKCWSVPHT